MTTIIKPTEAPQPSITRRTRRVLENILAQELALNLARGVLTYLDTLPDHNEFSVNLTSHQILVNQVTLTIHCKITTLELILGKLQTFPHFNHIGSQFVIGQVTEPHVILQFV